jgi:toluene monooxygenase system ferredoxin subunit
MSDWVDVYDDGELWDGDLAGVVVGKDKYVILRSNEELRAFKDACPHKGTPLSDGDLAEGVLTCPVHLWEFDVASGDSINPCGEKLQSFPIRCNGGRIEIEPATR